MIVDEERENVLTKYVSSKGNRKKVESDHNNLIGKFTLKFSTVENKVRREIFDFKNKEAQKMFHDVTNTSTKYQSLFDPDKSIEKNVNKFYKTLDDTLHQCFDKIQKFWRQ